MIRLEQPELRPLRLVEDCRGSVHAGEAASSDRLGRIRRRRRQAWLRDHRPEPRCVLDRGILTARESREDQVGTAFLFPADLHRNRQGLIA